jgi:hypothetical protein
MMITNQLIPPISNSDNPLFKEVAAGRSLPPLLTTKKKKLHLVLVYSKIFRTFADSY